MDWFPFPGLYLDSFCGLINILVWRVREALMRLRPVRELRTAADGMHNACTAKVYGMSKMQSTVKAQILAYDPQLQCFTRKSRRHSIDP